MEWFNVPAVPAVGNWWSSTIELGGSAREIGNAWILRPTTDGRVANATDVDIRIDHEHWPTFVI